MIKNYSTYINESIEEINFIPFELREEIDPNFTWNEKTEKNCYRINYNDMPFNERLIPSDKYLNEIRRRVIGKHVSFHTYSYRDGSLGKNHGVVIDIEKNVPGGICFTLANHKFSNGAVDERKPVTSYVPTYNSLDPYGEDDWD